MHLCVKNHDENSISGEVEEDVDKMIDHEQLPYQEFGLQQHMTIN